MKSCQLAGIVSACLALSSCYGKKEQQVIRFATSAEYPPFEYMENAEIKGFDIDLAHLIAKELNMEAKFEDMQYSTILPAIQNGMVDAGIATITITPERKLSFDFSDSYYSESLAAISPEANAVNSTEQLKNISVGCQIGSSMEFWLKENAPNIKLVTFDTNPQAIEALKGGHINCVLADTVQGVSFMEKNPELVSNTIAQSNTGYGIVFKKGSPLTPQVNKALKKLKENGELDKLKKKWLHS